MSKLRNKLHLGGEGVSLRSLSQEEMAAVVADQRLHLSVHRVNVPSVEDCQDSEPNGHKIKEITLLAKTATTLARQCDQCTERQCSLPTTSRSKCWWKRALNNPVKLQVVKESACERVVGMLRGCEG